VILFPFSGALFPLWLKLGGVVVIACTAGRSAGIKILNGRVHASSFFRLLALL